MPKRKSLARDERVVSGIICDDIRLEVGSKFSLMGVYTGDIQLPEFPAHVAIAMYSELMLRGGLHEVEFRFRVGDEFQSGMKGTVEVVRDGLAALPTARLPIVAKEPSTLVAEAKIDDSDWFIVTTKRIVVTPP